jgi:glucuronoarabinoxylan endo-1,4-beta-xylanase
VSSLEQPITGFGVSSAWDGNFNNASDPDYLWSTTTGAGLSLLRIRYGDGLTIAQAAVQHGVTVWMTVWGDGSGGAQGGPDTTTQTNPNGCTGSMPVLTNPSGLASSIVSYVQNAKSNGVTLYAVSGANEPDSCGINSTTSYSPAELATWIDTLGPAMANLGVKLMAPETENVCGFPSYFSAIQNDSNAWNAVNIVASHEYGCGTLPSEPSIAAAGKQYWETEISTGTGDDGINDGLTVAETMHNDLTQANVNAWHFWWLYSGSGSNGGLYDTTTNVWTKRLWAMGNFARFVRPGYMRVDTSGPSSYVGKAGCGSNNSTTPCVTAYRDQTNNTVVIVAINPGSSTASMSFYVSENAPCSLTPYVTNANDNLVAQSPITVSGSRFTASLTAQSITTFVGTP